MTEHELTCQCPECKRFWWTLFVTHNERDVLEPLGLGPLTPDATTPEADRGYPSHRRDPETQGPA